MKRLGAAVLWLGIATIAMGASLKGLRLPWNTVDKIRQMITNDSIWADSSFFKHDRTSDSMYSFYWSYSVGDSAAMLVLNGRGDKITVNDTLVSFKPYYKVVHAESLLPTVGYVLRTKVADSTWTDTFFFKHGRQGDSAYQTYWSYAIGDSVAAGVINGRGSKVTVNDTLVATKLYIDGIHAESLAPTIGYVDRNDAADSTLTDTSFFKHDDTLDKSYAIYTAKTSVGLQAPMGATEMFRLGLKIDSTVMMEPRSDSNHVDVDVTGNVTADSFFGYVDASLLQTKDTTDLWNAKTLQTKDTTFAWPHATAADSAVIAAGSHLLQTKDTTDLWNAKTLQGKDTTDVWPTSDSTRVSTIAYGPAGDTWTGAVAVYDEYQITGGFLLPYAPLNSRVCTLNYYVHLDTVFARTKVEAPRLIGRHVPVAFDTTSTATPTPNADLYDQYSLTALAADAAFAAPTGTPVDGQKLILRIEDNGTARALTWDAIYEACGDGIAAAIDSTTLSKKMYVGCIYNTANTKWDVVAVSEEE